MRNDSPAMNLLPEVSNPDAGGMTVVTREQEELRCAMIVARNFPRDESKAREKVKASCLRPKFADEALYSFPRGKTEISGPSVQLAREAARVWGHIRYGLRIVEDKPESVHVRGYAMDLETNAYVEAEDKFQKRHQRTVGYGEERKTVWVKIDDERDLRELINRRGAICVRNAILQLMPPDLIDECVELSVHTLLEVAEEERRQQEKAKAAPEKAKGPTKEEVIAKVVEAWAEIGVNEAMLEQFLGHPLKNLSPSEQVRLRTAYKSIVDGNTEVSDHFKAKADAAPDPQKQMADSLQETAVKRKLAKLAETGEIEAKLMTHAMQLFYKKAKVDELSLDQAQDLLNTIVNGNLESAVEDAKAPIKE